MRFLWVGIAFFAIVFIVLAVVAASDVARFDIGRLAQETPARTSLMRHRVAEAKKKGRDLRIDVRTVPYERISPTLRRAVLIAEDDAFFSHDGLDWNELKKSAKSNWKQKRVVRGGSTITQQLAKNLFLGSERSLPRKLREAFLARRIEKSLSKRRIFELYLNRIEWGDGIFGIEAAARRHFGVSAAALSPRQSVLLAAVIINPIRYSVHSPARRIERRAKMIAGRMRRRGYLSEEQYAAAIGAPPGAAASANDRSGLPDWMQLPFGPQPQPAPAADSAGAPESEPEPPPEDSMADSLPEPDSIEVR